MSDLGVDLEEFRAFIAAAETGSILRAAEQLRTSRSRVRRLLGQLEVSIGRPLLQRQRDGLLAVTPEGERFLPRAKELVSSVRLLVTAMRESHEAPRTRLRVAIQVGYPVVVGRMLERMLADRHGVGQVEFFVHERPASLIPHTADIALCLAEQWPEMHCTDIPLATLTLGLFASRAFLEDLDPIDTVEKAVPHIVGAWRPPNAPFSGLEMADGETHPLCVPTITPDESYLHYMAENREGIIYAPSFPHPIPGRPEPLVQLLPDTVGRELQVRMVVPDVLVDVPRLSSVVQAIRELGLQTP